MKWDGGRWTVAGVKDGKGEIMNEKRCPVLRYETTESAIFNWIEKS
jgi:hypothetical protein